MTDNLKPFTGQLDHPANTGGLKPFDGRLDGEPTKDNALKQGFVRAAQSARIAGNLAQHDYTEAAQVIADAGRYNQVNKQSEQLSKIGQAWDDGDGIVGGIKGAAGFIAKDIRNRGLAGVVDTASAFGEGLAGQVGNMAAPLVGGLAGAKAGAIAGGIAGAPTGLGAAPAAAGGAIVGGFLGASAGNAASETGGMVMDAIHKAGIDPTDTKAVEAFLRKNQQGQDLLGKAAVKGAVLGAVDTATAGIGRAVLSRPASAAADRALTKMGVDLADDAAVSAARQTDTFAQLVANDAAYQASQTGLRNAARTAAVGALDPAGEFAGEYLGQGLATGEWDTKAAALEAISSLGQSAIMLVGQKGYQVMTDPTRFNASDRKAAKQSAIETLAQAEQSGGVDPQKAAEIRQSIDTLLPDDEQQVTAQANVASDGAVDGAVDGQSDTADATTPTQSETAGAPDITPTQAETLDIADEADAPTPQKPSEAMGLDASKGSLSSAAVLAVDSGVNQQLQATEQSADNRAAESVGTLTDSDRQALGSQAAANTHAVGQASGQSGGQPATTAQSSDVALGDRGRVERISGVGISSYFDTLDLQARKDLAKRSGVSPRIMDNDIILDNLPSKVRDTLTREIADRYNAYRNPRPKQDGRLPDLPVQANAVPNRRDDFTPESTLQGDIKAAFDALPDNVQGAARLASEYLADRTLRNQRNLPPQTANYPAELLQAQGVLRDYIAKNPQTGRMLESMAVMTTAYRRNNGWDTPLPDKDGFKSSELADWVKPSDRQAVNPTVNQELTVADVNTPSGIQETAPTIEQSSTVAEPVKKPQVDTTNATPDKALPDGISAIGSETETAAKPDAEGRMQAEPQAVDRKQELLTAITDVKKDNNGSPTGKISDVTDKLVDRGLMSSQEAVYINSLARLGTRMAKQDATEALRDWAKDKNAFDAAITKAEKAGNDKAAKVLKKARNTSRGKKADSRLREDWGVDGDYINGQTVTDEFTGRQTDYGVKGGVKDAINDGILAHIKAVAAELSDNHGFALDANAKGKVIRPSINAAGVGGMGDVALHMVKDGHKLYLQIAHTGSVSGGYKGYYTIDNGSNNWFDPSKYTAAELADRIAKESQFKEDLNAKNIADGSPAEKDAGGTGKDNQQPTGAGAEKRSGTGGHDNNGDTRPVSTDSHGNTAPHGATPAEPDGRVEAVGNGNATRDDSGVGSRAGGDAVSGDGLQPDGGAKHGGKGVDSAAGQSLTSKSGRTESEALKTPSEKLKEAVEKYNGMGNIEFVTLSDSGRAATEENGGIAPSQAVIAEQTPSSYTADDGNFDIAQDGDTGKGGLKTQFKGNVQAIKTIKLLQVEDRKPTAAEQKIIAKWRGWGGMANAFRRPDGTAAKGWEREVEELELLLTKEEMDAAKESTLSAFYTPKEVITAMWGVAERLGFTGGRVLEPSVGAGAFIGLMPKSLRKSARVYGTELDGITGNIAKNLYPAANIKVMGFQHYDIPEGHFRVAIGNPPFGGIRITDKKQAHLDGLTIHNYFMAKSIDALEPNGLMAMVVTSSFMDAADGKTREYIAGKAELLGAVRLPNDAFKEASTSVTTDIVFLRKRAAGEAADGAKWTRTRTVTDKDGNALPLNEYFADNKDMMLGEFGAFSGMYGGGTAAVVARDGQDTNALMMEALGKIQGGFITQPSKTEAQAEAETVVNVPDVFVGQMFTQDGNVYERMPDVLGERSQRKVEFADDAKKSRAIGMIGVREALVKLRNSQLDKNADESQIESDRKALNDVYDGFVKQFGHINNQTNTRVFRNDPGFPQLAALEENFEPAVSANKEKGIKAKKSSARKAAIFSKRTQYPTAEVTSVSNAKDGMIESLSNVGYLDMARISRLYGKDESAIVAELGDLVYQDPVFGWQEASEYLSGNVKAKLKAAKDAAAKNPEFKRNVEALEAVQPEDVEAADIEVRIGSHWIPAKHMGRFLSDSLGITVNKANMPVYSRLTNEWELSIPGYLGSDKEAMYGTSRVKAAKIFSSAINGKQLTVYDTRDDKSRVVNQQATEEAAEKIESVKRLWADWVFQDAERRNELAALYNGIFNTDVQRHYDGSHLKLVGKVDDSVIELRPTQKDAVYRITQSQTTLLDHVVGAGKTFTMVAAAMELRRLGLSNKPMIVVPNHLVGQWSKEFLQLYPNANVLAITKEDLEKNNRRRFVGRVANGDWDAVIIAHSSFGKISVDPEFEKKFIQQQIREITDAIEESRKEQGKGASRFTDLQKRIKNLSERFKRLSNSESKDTDNLNWSELGVDALMVDEAHEFKNLAFSSNMQKVAGLGNQSGSNKAMDLFMKIRQMSENPNSKIVFATGTPISNSMAEMYTMQRYLDYDRMEQDGTLHFDAWAKTYGEVVSDWELSASGKYQMRNRFAKFVNMPELMQRYLSFADVINRDDINESLKAQGKVLPVPKIKGGKPQNIVVPRSAYQAEYIGLPEGVDSNGNEIYPKHSLVYRAEHLPKGQAAKEKGADNMLRIIGEARKLALDPRIINPAAEDDPNSKVNIAVSEIKRIYDAWSSEKGTQLVFIDLSTPNGSKAAQRAELVELVAKADAGDEAAAERIEKNYSPDDIEAILSNNTFSVYDDMKAKLIKAGIPSSEVAFIHDANTEDRKQKLFDKVRAGEVRVLFGSTMKMGAGTNVQNRLVALHHMDAPWRPSDLEQREGRIIRQGNELYSKDPEGFEVEIMRYATESTMDAMQWQIIESKAKFISQVRKGDVKSRQIEDIGEEAANAGAMKAAASGNPLVLREMELRKAVKDLESEQSRFNRNQYRIQDSIAKTEAAIPAYEKAVKSLESLAGIPVTKEFDFTVGDKRFKQGEERARESGGLAVMVEVHKVVGSRQARKQIGKFGAFNLHIEPSQTNFDNAVLTFEANGHETGMTIGREDAVSGVVTRMQNVLNRIPEDLQETKDRLEYAKKSLDGLKPQLAEWGKRAELEKALQEHAEVLSSLKSNKKMSIASSLLEGGKGKGNISAIRRALNQHLGDISGRIKLVSSMSMPDSGRALIGANVEGWYDSKTGEVALLADNLTPERAVWVAWHELGHKGFAAKGWNAYKTALERLATNANIAKIADRIQAERINAAGVGDQSSQVRSVAIEEAFVELYAAQQTGNWKAISERYGVDFNKHGGLEHLRESIRKFLGLVKRVIQSLFNGRSQFDKSVLSDSEVIAMLNELHYAHDGMGVSSPANGVRYTIDGGNTDNWSEDGHAELVVDEQIGAAFAAEDGTNAATDLIEHYRMEHLNALIQGHTELSLPQYAAVRTKAFKEWFGDWENDPKNASQVINPRTGEPLVVYHGSGTEFEAFKNQHGLKDGSREAGFFFTDKRWVAETYGKHVAPLFLNIRRPKRKNVGGKVFHQIPTVMNGQVRNATTDENIFKSASNGNFHDGFLFQNIIDDNFGLTKDTSNVWVAFSANQAKHAEENNGQFSRRDDRMKYSIGANMKKVTDSIVGKDGSLKNFVSDRFENSKSVQLQFLGRRQLTEIYGSRIRGMKKYERLSELFAADGNMAAVEADRVVSRWGKLSDSESKNLADLMHDATLNKTDADPEKESEMRKRLSGVQTALDIQDGIVDKSKNIVRGSAKRIKALSAKAEKAFLKHKKVADILADAEEKAGRPANHNDQDKKLYNLFHETLRAKREMQQAEADVMAERQRIQEAIEAKKAAEEEIKRLEQAEKQVRKEIDNLPELQKRFRALSKEAQEIYRTARDDYKKHYGKVREAVAERMARNGQANDVIEMMRNRFDNEIGGVYFPLARFGDYLIVVKDKAGNNVNVSRAETMSEAQATRAALMKDFSGDEYTVSNVLKSKEYISSQDAVSRGFMKELNDALGGVDLNPEQRAELNDTLTQLYLNSLPDLSWAKSGIHRKGMAGFSDDARRAYARNMSTGANYLAKLRYADRMAEQLGEMQEFVDSNKYNTDFNQVQYQRVVDEMKKRHDAIMNPTPSKLAQTLTSFGFLWMMGFSPASAIVNLSQTAMVAYPVMAAKWGWKEAGRELLKASKQISTGLKNGKFNKEKFNTIVDSLNEDEKSAFDKAVAFGIIDLSQAHDLAQVANGEGNFVGDKWRSLMDKASWLFHHAEKFNRQVTFVAAYRLAKQAGASSVKAFEQAKKATYDGHFDYASQNRPRFMMGNTAKVIFLFKQYSQNILYALGRNAYLTFKGDKEARKILAGILTTHAMASGLLGLPFVTTMLAIASMIGGDEDDPFDAETSLRNLLSGLFGDTAGEVMAKGFSRLTPFDVSGRVGLNNLIFPDIQDGLEGRKWAESAVVGMTGAVVGAGINTVSGAQQVFNGEVAKGLENMLPNAIRNPLKSLRYATEGQVDKTGIVIKDDFNPFEIGGQAIGFRPSDLALRQEGKAAVYAHNRELNVARTKLLTGIAKAIMEKDQSGVEKFSRRIREWNAKHPTRAIGTNNIVTSIKSRQRRIDGSVNGVYVPKNRRDSLEAGNFAFDG